MFAIKMALIVVGIFIVLATGFITLEIYHRLSASRNIDPLTSSPGTSSPDTFEPGGQSDSIAANMIELAPGLRIEALAPAGRYLAFLTRQGDRAGSIYIFDPHRLKIIAIISANPSSGFF